MMINTLHQYCWIITRCFVNWSDEKALLYRIGSDLWSHLPAGNVAFFTIIWLLFSPNTSTSQPMASSKQLISQIEVYKDYKKSNLYYYAPGDLKLAKEADDKPKFQLLEIRYTGTSAYADAMEKRFLNVVQFTILMDVINKTDLKEIKKHLGGRNISLRPLPIKNVEAILVAPVKDNQEEYERIGKSGSFQAENSSGKSSRNSYWTERTFTLKLENHEAQLLWDQIETGHLALSFGYIFYADIMTGGVGDIMVSGEESFVDKMESNTSYILSADTIISTQVIKSNSFPIRVDVKRWPELINKVDINEEVPPAYAALEVKCYDFSDNLRPDLALKTIEIQATGVGGSMVKLPARKFLRGQPDLHTIHVRFPYAVKMNKALRYRIAEYNLDGIKKETDWISKDSWTEIIDITTPFDNNKIAKKELEIEADPRDWKKDSIEKVEFIIQYSFNGEHKQLSNIFEKNETLPLRVLSFQFDIDKPLLCQHIWFMNDGTIIKEEKYNPKDDYLFIDPPDF